jgi:hypothetical protein
VCDGACHWQVGACNGQGACAPGSSYYQACGNCGSQLVSCDNSCNWVGGACTGEGECSPGTYDSRACGNCDLGVQDRVCDDLCQWPTWSTCIGGGTCAPNATQQGTCMDNGYVNNCEQKTCKANCTWGACTVKPDVACNWEGGTNFRCCSPSGGGTGWQFCLSNCSWSTGCSSHACP